MRRATVLVLVALTGCGNKTGSSLGGIEVHVHYAISIPEGGCIRIQAVPEQGAPAAKDFPLAGLPRDGGLEVAIAPQLGWSRDVSIPGSLHRADDCNDAPVA